MSVWPNVFRPITLVLIVAVASVLTFATIGGKLASFISSRTGIAQSASGIEQGNRVDDPLTIGSCDTAGPVEVESSGGTTTPTAYATMKAAFDAIIAGTHTGSINIEICGNTTETATAALNASGTGSASYTDVTIRPVGGARVIEGSIVGAIVKLNGADNVTIDGRQGGAGTARDLTVRNTNTSTATAAIWLASVAAGNGASNNTIRNLEIAAGQTANTGTNTTIGVYMGGTTISLTSTDGNDNDNNNFLFNRITRARYGIATRGVTTNNNISPVITDNIIGPTSFGADEIGKAGIYMQADTGAIVSRNTVQFVGGDLANTTSGADRCGICIGAENWSVTDSTTITSGDYTVTRNSIHDIAEERTFSAIGIRLGTTRSGVATNNLIANNFIYNVRANSTSGDQVVGIGYANGNTDRIVFNSISITGDQDPGAAGLSTTYGNGIRITQANAANNANLTVANNSIYLDASSGTAANRYYAITANVNSYSFGTGFENNNNYYIVPTNTQLRTGGFATTGTGSSATTEFATLANWQAAFTTPQDANSIQADPAHFSLSDLHISPSSPNVNAGVTIAGILDDIDGQARPNGPSPDIGADEFYPSPGTLQFSSSTFGGSEAGGTATATVTRTAGINGAVSVNYATVAGGSATGGASCTAGIDYINTNGTLMWADLESANKTFNITLCADGVLEPGETINIALSSPVGATLGTPSTAVVNISDSTVFSGSYNVGTGETLTSLTNPGGFFDAINNGSLSGNVTINITSDLAGETGTVALNEVAGGFSVTIKPAGASRTITGSSTSSVIRLNGADNVTIDGSLTGATGSGVGGTDSIRNLTVLNTNPAATAGAVIAVMQGPNSANNVTIKNVKVAGQSPTQTLIGIHIGGNAIGASPTVAPNTNAVVDNCSFQRSFIALFNNGVSAALPATGSAITRNDISATGANRMRRAGIFFFAQNGIQVTENKIGGIVGDEAADAIGIIAGIQDVNATNVTNGGVSNANISRNRIDVITSANTTGFSAVGIAIAGDPAGPNTIANNMISGVSAPSTSPDFVAGIFVAGVTGSNTKLFYNTVSNTGARGSVASQIGSYGLAISGTNPTVELKNNIFYNTQTSAGGANAKSYSIGMTSTTFTNLDSNFNDFFTSGANAAGFRTGSLDATGTDLANLAAWQAAVSDDANSQAVDPSFIDPIADPHLQATTPVENDGTPIAGITDDIDGNTRSAAAPEIGADELATPGTLAFSAATYTIGEAGPTVTLTVNRTGGSDGSVQVDYAFGGGTATGGGSCATPGVDYVNVGSSLVFANAETSKTFDVTICNDSVFEGDETFNSTLSNATGGATIGSPNPATVTITDNETQPTVQFSSGTYSTTESLGDSGSIPVVTINVTLSGASQSAVTVDYATVAGGSATGGATCAAGVDYINTSGTLNIPANTLGASFNVPVCADVVPEPSETVNLALTSPVGATLGTPNTAVLTINDNDTPASPVTVTATAGMPGPTGYATLSAAIAAINAGTHQGDIVVSINQNTTEPGSIVINSSGAGSASYTSMIIRPTADGLTVAGPTVQGRGLIELNGADNVDINGDNASTGGTNRNLTLKNTAANTVTFTSVVRIALAATVVTTANGNTIRNLNLLGSATGRNVGTATTTTGTENTTFGVFVGPGASATDATAAPAAVASVVTGAPAAATATNLIVSNNGIATVARAVSVNAAAATNFPGLQITNNSIGNAIAGDPDQVTAVGITASGAADGVIRDNTVWVEGYVGSSAAGHAIAVGVNGAFGAFTIENNKVNRVRNNNPATWSAFGINLGGSSNHIVQNNFVSGVINNQVAGTGGFGTTFGAYGIRVASGTGHKVYHNSVHLYGALPGVVSTDLTAAMMVVGTTQTGVDVRNNIFSNQISGGNPTGTRNVSLYLPSGATSAMNLTLNNNAYYAGGDALNRLAQVGTTFGAGEFQVADFDPTSTTPATNLRSYTSTLSAAGTNDNASFATTAPPPFVSNVDLHIPAATATRLESGGAAVGVGLDIDAETRNATTPDIGADEFAGNPAPANDIAASSFVTPANGSTIPTGAAFTPQARFLNNGTAVQTNVPVRFRIIDAGMTTIYNQTATIPTINPLQVVTVTFPSTTIVAPGTYSMIATAENPSDSNPGNDSINGTFSAVTPIGGTITVGTGGDYTSLTNPGGVFQALNTAGISGNVVVNIISDLAGETGAVALNQLAEAGVGGYTVTFKPSGAARTINGTGATSNGIINMNGADRIIFDGSLAGGSDRSLTITNSQTGTSTIFWIKSASASNGANSNTIKNLILTGTGNTTAQTTAGILAGSGVTIGGPAEAPNNNNTITNNWIYRVQNSLYNQGNVGFDQNWSITNNEFGSSVELDKNRFRGMLMGNANNFTISGNTVHGVTNFTGTTGANTGIQIAFTATNGMVVNNRISDIHNLSTTGTGAFGMQLGSTTTTNVVIANNFIWDIQANGSATVTSNGHGITVNGAVTAGGFKLYFNSINMNTNQVTAGTSAALNVTTAVVAAGALDVRNNIFSNTQTTGTRYGVFSAAPASVFGTINYNDYFAQNVGNIGGTARVTLADWQAATGQDANSKAVDPLFVSATDLHLQAGSPMLASAVAGTGITTDIDGDTRQTPPDIGADEIVSVAVPGSLQFSSATYSVGEAGPTATITVTRTGGSDGTVSAQYASSNGSATGGASCAAGIDYLNTSGTVTFVDGDTSETFSVPICQDAADEPDETVNLALSNPTGGATIGSPANSVLTIVDDDVPVLGTFSINDLSLREGNSGAVNFVFTISYTGPVQPASVQYATANGTAVSGVDYLPASGTVTFNSPIAGPEGLPAPQTATITVVVNSDVVKEANETFFVNLSNPTGGTIADGQGVGIIIDDDRAYVADFDRDLVSDFSVFRPSDSTWYVRESASNVATVVPFGTSGDIAVPGDYDGDGQADFAVWRPSNGTWYRILSSNSSTVISAWGASTDKPVQGDYDGDGKTDLAIFRPSTGEWWIFRSSTGTSATAVFGISTDRPIQGDYDGDGMTDLAVYRSGTWYIARSSGTILTANWGIATDLPISGDFDGDGKFDLAIYRNGDWWILRSLTGTVQTTPWGNATDIPAPADYDGDGTTDIAIFRPSTGNWHVVRSSNGTTFGLLWGLNGDVPVPSAYVHP